MLCGWSLDATVKGGDRNPEAGGSTPELWTIIEFLTPGNIVPYDIPTLGPRSTQEAASSSARHFSKIGIQPCPLVDRLPKVMPSPLTSQNTLLDMALSFRKSRSSSTHQNTDKSSPTGNLHKALFQTHPSGGRFDN